MANKLFGTKFFSMHWLLATLLLLSCCSLYSQDQEVSAKDDFHEMSLEEILNIKISLASKTDLTVRESPSVVTIITAEEIQNLGARDLIDVLSFVPGLNFGTDVGGVVGLSSRGNWSHEGKVLVLLDGQEMNEILFSNTAFGQHYDINQIKRVEIIRGPGSSVYGGFAELGVINIITKSGADLKGLQASTSYGLLADSYARRNVSLSVGNSNDQHEFSVSGFVNQGRRSNLTYEDIYGAQVSMKNHSEINSGNINVGFRTGNFSARFIYDYYHIASPWYFDSIVVTPSSSGSIVDFDALYSEVKYDLKLKRGLVITPKVNFKVGSPWSSNADHPIEYYQVLASRLSPSINVSYQQGKLINVVGGVDSNFDYGKLVRGSQQVFFNDTEKLSFYNIGAFVQASLSNRIAPLFLGARVDNHSQFGTAFSPRIGITHVFDSWHFKLLYSRSFRAPAIENLNKNPDLIPERSGVAEAELGFEISSKMWFTINAYDIRISDPIVYFFNDLFPSGSYINYKNTGTRGIELEYKIKAKAGYVNFNYSFYHPGGLNQVPIYQVPNRDDVLLGWPTSRLNVNGNYQLTPQLSINPSFILMSKRHALTSYDATTATVIYGEVPGKAYLNLFIRYKDLLTDGLELGIGVHDLTNEVQTFIQPYDSYTAPMSGVGREFLVRLRYNVKF